MKEERKKDEPDEQDQPDNVLSSEKRDAKKAKEFWTKEEMDKAKPIPFPKKSKKPNENVDAPKTCDDE